MISSGYSGGTVAAAGLGGYLLGQSQNRGSGYSVSEMKQLLIIYLRFFNNQITICIFIHL